MDTGIITAASIFMALLAAGISILSMRLTYLTNKEIERQRRIRREQAARESHRE